MKVQQLPRKLKESRMTSINEVNIPVQPGTCLHAILVALLENKNKFVPWSKILRLVSDNMVRYGGEDAWRVFYKKCSKNQEQLLQKIKTNIRLVMQVGKKTQGYKLHSRGVVVYLFKDGIMARTGGKFIAGRGRGLYSVKFKDGTGFQQSDVLTSYREYKDTIINFIDEETEADE